jgi:uncharacterized protein (TIGR01244 family)
MRIRRINGMFTIANQVDVNKVEKLAEAGYKTLICNRPDKEGDDQACFADVAAEAQRLGMTAVYLPISESGTTPSDQQAFDAFIFETPKPIVAYCRTGTRPAALWSEFDRVQNGGRADGPERRVDALQVGAMSVQHAASMAFAARFNTPSVSTVTQIGQTGVGRRSA